MAQAKELPPRHRTIIIGGGIGGCYTALRLAEAGVPVTIIEGRDKLLSGTSDRTPGRLGLGFHYRHLETAKTYLRSTIAFARSSLLDKSGKLKFVVGGDKPWNHPLRHGRYFITKDSQVPAKELLAVYEGVRQEYARLIAQDPGNKVFGEPKDFFRILKPSEYEGQVKPGIVEVGIETNEHLLDWPAFKADLLKKISANSNINVVTRQAVMDANYNSDGSFGLVTWNPEEGKQVHKASHVVNATWENIELINSKLGLADRSVVRTNRLKVLAKIELPENLKNAHSMFFCMGPHAMTSNIGNGMAFLTHAKTTNIDSSTSLKVPSKWLPKLYGPQIGELFGIVKSKGTVDIDDPASPFHERNYSGVEEGQIGWVDNACMKLFYCERNAQEILGILRKHQQAGKEVSDATNAIAKEIKIHPDVKSAIGIHMRRNFTPTQMGTPEDWLDKRINTKGAEVKYKAAGRKTITKDLINSLNHKKLITPENIRAKQLKKTIIKSEHKPAI